MKKILKILLLLNFSIIAPINLTSCTSIHGGSSIEFYFYISVAQVLSENVFESEKEVFEKIKEAAKDAERQYNITIFEEINNDVNLNENDLGYTVQIEDNFFEINKKNIKVSIISTKEQNEVFIWNYEKPSLIEETITFNINSYRLSIEGEGEHIGDNTLHLWNGDKQKNLTIKGYSNPKNIYFQLFYKDDDFITIFAESPGVVFSSKGEWEFEYDKEGNLSFNGFNNSIPSQYSKLRIIEKVKEKDYRWFDLTLRGDSKAYGSVYFDMDRKNSVKVRTSTTALRRGILYQIYKKGKLIILVRNLSSTEVELERFDFLWEDNTIFDKKNIKIIEDDDWNWVLTFNYDHEKRNQLKVLKIIPKSIDILMKQINIKFIDEEFIEK